MKVLLVNSYIPFSFYNREFYLPIGLMYLAAVLKKNGDEVKILDLKTFQKGKDPPIEFFHSKVIDTIKDFKPELLGWGCLYSGNFSDILKISKLVKENFPTLKQAIGGIHATIYPYEILKNCLSLDFVILGEGEETIVDLVNNLENTKSLIDIPGFAFRDSSGIHINNKENFIKNLDELPLPAYNLINFEDYYTDTSIWHNPKKHEFHTSVPIITSRSCPNRCTFCIMWKVMGPMWRGRSAKNVVDEIEYVYKTYNQKHFSFMDDNISLNKKRLLDICDEIKKRKLDIQFETPNGISVKTLDEEVLDALVSAGFIRTYLAIESGSEFIRNTIMRKNLPQHKIYEVVDLMRRKYPQLAVNALFIIGMPEETKETLEDTYNMIEKLNPDKTIVMNIVPFPGTHVFEQTLKDDLFIDFDTKNLYLESDRYFTNYDRFFIKPYKLTIEDLKDFRRRINKLLNNQKEQRLKK